MAGPYTKVRADVFDDGWAVHDGNGEPIAYCDTEKIADCVMHGLLECPELPDYGEDEPYGDVPEGTV